MERGRGEQTRILNLESESGEVVALGKTNLSAESRIQIAAKRQRIRFVQTLLCAGECLPSEKSHLYAP